ncbi:MAG: hypothetical protein D6704_02230 [Nitrospirae bacterium]|nr:MAG: hypothetical protein D6704_02230 [Nitrospirota bacterium]
MLLVNPCTAFQWSEPLDINGIPMRGIREKQGYAFSRVGYLATKENPDLDPDDIGRAYRQQLRPYSQPTLLQARRDYEQRHVPRFPPYFIIEPTNVCNKVCPFCTITVMERTDAEGKVIKGFMKWETFLRLMEETSQYPVYGISLYQLGESFLWHGKDESGRKLHIADMVNAAKRIGGFQAVNLSTNGDVANLASILGSELDDLIISIDGTTKEVYEQNRPGASGLETFERTLERVHEFLHTKYTRGLSKPFVRLQIINKENTRDQIVEFIRYWIEVPGVDDVFVKDLDSMRSWLGNRVVSDEEDRIKAERVETMPCQHLFAIGSMVVNGDFTACCHDAYTQLVQKVTLPDGRTVNANIHNTSFAAWWNGPFMTQLRAEHLTGYFRMPCRDCRERDPWLG